MPQRMAGTRRSSLSFVRTKAESAVISKVHRSPWCITRPQERREYVNPTMYLPDDSDDDTIYVFASKAGAPSHPDWFYNLTAAGEGTVERGTDTYGVTVRELSGDERDRVYNEQARRYPGFADYAQRTAGIRTIPVLELRRS